MTFDEYIASLPAPVSPLFREAMREGWQAQIESLEAAGAVYQKQSFEQAAEISRLKGVIAKCKCSLSKGLEYVDEPPKRNCSCHIRPPCNDCVDHSALREFFNDTREALAAIKEEGL